jgi:hypothetical protein
MGGSPIFRFLTALSLALSGDGQQDRNNGQNEQEL